MEGCVTDNDIRDALRSLPEGLEETYIRILKQIHKHPKSLRTRIRRVLRLVVCYEHIEIDDLTRLLDIAEMGADWDPDKIINDPLKLISGCGHLVSITLSEGKPSVTLTHLTVYDFLTNDPHSFDSTLPQYHCYPLHDAVMETAGIFLKKHEMRGCPYRNTTWEDECRLVSRWRRISDFEASTPHFLSSVFNAPLNENARPGPSLVFPNATEVTAINCRFLIAEDMYYILTSSQPANFSRGPYIWEKVFPRIAKWTALEIKHYGGRCGIHVQDDQRATTEPVGHPSSRNATHVTVEDIDFIYATNSNWTIYPGVEIIPGVTKTGRWNQSFYSHCTIVSGWLGQYPDSHVISLQHHKIFWC